MRLKLYQIPSSQTASVDGIRHSSVSALSASLLSALIFRVLSLIASGSMRYVQILQLASQMIAKELFPLFYVITSLPPDFSLFKGRIMVNKNDRWAFCWKCGLYLIAFSIHHVATTKAFRASKNIGCKNFLFRFLLAAMSLKPSVFKEMRDGV